MSWLGALKARIPGSVEAETRDLEQSADQLFGAVETHPNGKGNR